MKAKEIKNYKYNGQNYSQLIDEDAGGLIAGTSVSNDNCIYHIFNKSRTKFFAIDVTTKKTWRDCFVILQRLSQLGCNKASVDWVATTIEGLVDEREVEDIAYKYAKQTIEHMKQTMRFMGTHEDDIEHILNQLTTTKLDLDKEE